MTDPRVLILAYGNPGRRDDGLGPAAAACLEGDIARLAVSCCMQLGPEDAALVAAHKRVIFLDAGEGVAEPFAFQKVKAARSAAFTTHALRPETVLALSREAFGVLPRAWHMVIRGYDFDFGDGISPPALRNMNSALDHIRLLVRRWEARDASE